MKLALTVNLGNYENIRIESSEYDSIDDCKSELNLSLASFREPRVNDFRKKFLG